MTDFIEALRSSASKAMAAGTPRVPFSAAQPETPKATPRMPGVDLKSLPNLPGFNFPSARDGSTGAPFSAREQHHKGQTWGFVASQRMEIKEGLTHDRPKMVYAVKPKDTWRHGTIPVATSRETYTAAEKDYDKVPAWDALDRHVLRFWGHFKESVVESNYENYRVRKVVVFYYLEDDTMHITEPKKDDSGLPQGMLIRRHRFPGPQGTYVKSEDLKVGGVLTVYGKSIHLHDCDAFTREYFNSLGMPQPAGSPQSEDDPWTTAREESKMKVASGERTYEKLYREVMLGGGHINENMQQFMENDGRVCRFFAVLDDVATAQFERRPFTILFFLSDDTVEIREKYPLNSGRDNFPIFFRRAKLASGKVEALGPQDRMPKSKEYVQLENLSVGQEIELVHHKFFIYDADDFTREYFKEALGVELDSKKDVMLPERPTPRAPTPPYTGYGSWDDSMSSVLHLIPKVPRRDFHKLYANDGKVLRFTAKFANPKLEDELRRFVVNFHLFDDTLSIHEPPQRNLGVVTGKFLEKGVHLNQATGRLFEPRDLIPGNIVMIFNHEYEILDMDEYTAKYLAGDPSGASVDLQAVLEKLRESMRQQFPLARDVFRRFDTSHNGVITLSEFKQALLKFGFQLAEEEVTVIMRHFDQRQDGQVTYNEFCDALLDEDYTLTMLQSKPVLDTTVDPDYAGRAQAKLLERTETEKVRKAVRQIGEVFYKHTGFQQKIIKEFTHMTHLDYVNCEQIRDALGRIGFSFEVDDVERCILFVLPGADLEKIDYVYFVKSLVACYHDLHQCR